MVAAIGIKIANGEFYPIIDENSNVRKRLVLTTVHDKQHSVQIDLYKSYTRTMADGLYIGSLVVEDIKGKLKGEPSIEMTISCDAEGHISAEALDLDTGSGGHHQYLSVSLKSLDENNRDIEVPDFELEQHEGLYGRASAIKESREKKKKGLWPLVIILGVLAILICLALFFFLTRGRDFFDWGKTGTVESARPGVPEISAVQPDPPVQPAPAQPAPARPAATGRDAESSSVQPVAPGAASPVPTTPAVPEAPRQTPPLIEAPPLIEPPAQTEPVPAVNRRRNPPVASYKVPATIPRNGVVYRIRWGDTLWDIAEAFYRDPWLYPRIARHNGIRNPDLIVSGTTIRIPPKN
jgi:nucleoid-associated protein YgaU